MAYTDINSEDRLVQATFAEHLESVLGWDSINAWNKETFGPTGTLGRSNEMYAIAAVVICYRSRSALRSFAPAVRPCGSRVWVAFPGRISSKSATQTREAAGRRRASR